MSDNISFKDVCDLWEEIKLAQSDKNRTIKNVNNTKVKRIIEDESKLAISTGFASGLAGVVSGTLVTTATTGGLGLASGLMTGGISTAAFTASGAAAGSAVPVVGTIIGAGIGLAAGVAVGKHQKKKKEQEVEALKQEVLKKQNTIIKDLREEAEYYKEKYGEAAKQNERYKYIIGILLANEELKSA